MANKKSQIDKAMELALSCRRCGHFTDAEFNEKTATWSTYCDCGKTNKHPEDKINQEVQALLKTVSKK
jgi:DNA replicative helicase MCM subunit Mcm2 (Cdc46/Mcm family)